MNRFVIRPIFQSILILIFCICSPTAWGASFWDLFSSGGGKNQPTASGAAASSGPHPEYADGYFFSAEVPGLSVRDLAVGMNPKTVRGFYNLWGDSTDSEQATQTHEGEAPAARQVMGQLPQEVGPRQQPDPLPDLITFQRDFGGTGHAEPVETSMSFDLKIHKGLLEGEPFNLKGGGAARVGQVVTFPTLEVMLIQRHGDGGNLYLGNFKFRIAAVAGDKVTLEIVNFGKIVNAGGAVGLDADSEEPPDWEAERANLKFPKPGYDHRIWIGKNFRPHYPWQPFQGSFRGQALLDDLGQWKNQQVLKFCGAVNGTKACACIPTRALDGEGGAPMGEVEYSNLPSYGYFQLVSDYSNHDRLVEFPSGGQIQATALEGSTADQKILDIQISMPWVNNAWVAPTEVGVNCQAPSREERAYVSQTSYPAPNPALCHEGFFYLPEGTACNELQGQNDSRTGQIAMAYACLWPTPQLEPGEGPCPEGFKYNQKTADVYSCYVPLGSTNRFQGGTPPCQEGYEPGSIEDRQFYCLKIGERLDFEQICQGGSYRRGFTQRVNNPIRGSLFDYAAHCCIMGGFNFGN